METNTTIQTEKNCINKGRPVYFSYARSSTKKPGWEHISDCVDTLLKVFEEENIEYRLDKRDIGTGDKISDFEREIGWKSEAVVLVFSDKYFRSPHCMYEFVQIKKSLEMYPQKRLLCIKSGDFNLSDVNYIMDLERFWNSKKQEYEEIEFHRLRNHSGTEQAAFENGFYLEDIRQLYSFFSAINYQNSSSIQTDGFINDIRKYYSTTPKPKLQPLFNGNKKKINFSIPLFVLLGIVCMFVFLAIFVRHKFLAIAEAKKQVNENTDSLLLLKRYYPVYSRGQDNFFVTGIRLYKDSTWVLFTFINTNGKDTAIYATENCRIIASGESYNIKNAEIAMYPEKTIVKKDSTMLYSMTFPAIPPNLDSVDFEGVNGGIYGIQLKREHIKIIDEPRIFTGNFDYLYIYRIEINKDETVLMVSCYNYEESTYLSMPDSMYLLCNHEKYYLKCVSGMATYPDSTYIPANAQITFAMIFQPLKIYKQRVNRYNETQLKVSNTGMIDCIWYEDEENDYVDGFFGININKKY